MRTVYPWPRLSRLTPEDLNRYSCFIEWQLIRVPESELDYWEREQHAVTVEQLGRQAAAALKQLPYSLSIDN